jgi:hypothetical protein
MTLNHSGIISLLVKLRLEATTYKETLLFWENLANGFTPACLREEIMWVLRQKKSISTKSNQGKRDKI